MRAATTGAAATAHLHEEIGAIRPGMKADLAILDLRDPAFVPFNSAARQLVYSECGRSVETVIVDGKVVVRDHRLTTVNEDELRARVSDVMQRYRKDLDQVAQRNARFVRISILHTSGCGCRTSASRIRPWPATGTWAGLMAGVPLRGSAQSSLMPASFTTRDHF
jgi:hypothetical protein